MDHIVSDWTRSDAQELNTYRGFMRLTAISCVFLVIFLLALMAIFLL